MGRLGRKRLHSWVRGEIGQLPTAKGWHERPEALLNLMPNLRSTYTYSMHPAKLAAMMQPSCREGRLSSKELLEPEEFYLSGSSVHVNPLLHRLLWPTPEVLDCALCCGLLLLHAHSLSCNTQCSMHAPSAQYAAGASSLVVAGLPRCTA